MRFSLHTGKLKRSVTAIAVCTGILLSHSLQAGEVEFEASGNIALEQRYFFDDALSSQQLSHSQTSFSVEPELYWQWNDGSDSLLLTPFYRVDSHDSQRTHGDIRELAYIHASDDWELRLGIRKEFWGGTEFQHLVDVINQTDGVEDFDGEDKLGQQMVNLSLVNDWGIVDVFLLPGFRERTYAGSEGRLRGPLVVDEDDVSYESSAGQQHLDVALRWSHSIGDFDLGASWFHGTNREAYLTPTAQNTLQQYYSQMDQLGVDVQATLGDWLWKFESIYRSTSLEDFMASQAGFEYSFVGVFESNIDLGLLMEHSWDSRGEVGLGAQGSLMQNDLFVGARLAFNDMQSSELLMGFGSDLDHNAFSFIIEANRRFGDNFIASLDVRLLQSNDENDLLYTLSNDDHAQLSLAWYF
ncbi:hypothetical protein [Colwellia sp. 12G3]|uniref:hypothetical protein n=1 Tax=Colwellia sp. 12G3 TaxID=2058299 RepID=UPI000C33CE18|nr:hypothetical protein [Colwellia sp. 12G3]PKI16856.1 hypothetical protein CXF71_06310 [Colwellia sp. 12G3]